MTPTLEQTPLPYHADPLTRFERLRQRPHAVLLDSGFPAAPGGRYDIISSDPVAWLEIDRHGRAISNVKDLPDAHYKLRRTIHAHGKGMNRAEVLFFSS